MRFRLLGLSLYPCFAIWLAGAAVLSPTVVHGAQLSQIDRDFDVDFEADDILALNMSGASKGLARALGFRLQATEPLRNLRLWLVRLRAPPGMNARAALERLRASDPQGFYGINESYFLAEAPATCAGIRCYGATMVGWGPAGCSLRTRIAMVDGALSTASPALTHSHITIKSFGRGRASTREKAHGTAIASLLVGDPASGFPSLLPHAQLVAADVFSEDSSGRLTSDTARITAALDWIAGEGPAVVNMSLEGPNSNILGIAIRRLIESGITVVAAAGNHGPGAPPQYPGAFPGVIAVTAVDRFKQVYPMANQGSYIGLSAPGVGIWTADVDGGGSLKDGTSFAAPFVTAAVAQIRAQDGSLSPAAAAELLKRSAIDLGAPGPDPVYGAGLLQVSNCGVR